MHNPAPRARIAVSVVENESLVRLRVAGELDIATAPELQSVVDRVARAGRTLVLDLSHLEFIDSIGVSLIYRLHVRAREDGLGLRLVPGRRAVMRVFDLTGLTDRLPFE